MSYSQESLAQALSAYRAGNYRTIRAAADTFSIPYSTLKDHVNKRHKVSSLADRQRLSSDQEQYLVDWISELVAAKNPPSHALIWEMARKILKAQGDNAPLGKQWVRKFLRRNPSANTTLASSLESTGTEGVSYDAISRYYNTFYEVKQRSEIQDADVWNVDEVGMASGVISNGTLIAPATIKKAPQTREWVTVIESVSMNGKKIRPLIIFRGEDLENSWFEEETPEFFCTTSSDGWTSNKIGMNWLRDIFIPETTPSLSSRWRLLLVGGHGIHDNVEFLWECKQNQVHVIFEPPRTPHILQLLDLVSFSPLKSRYRNILVDLSSLYDGALVKKRNFISYYCDARTTHLTERQILAGWEAGGLNPWNPLKALESIIQRPAPRPRTPRLENSPFDPEKTPNKPSDMKKILDHCRSLGSLEDSYSFLEKAFERASRRMGLQSAELAKKDTRIETLEFELAKNDEIKEARDRVNAATGSSSSPKDTMMLQQGEIVSSWGTAHFPEPLEASFKSCTTSFQI
ncbi:hypothetical protein K3495_g10303 [Podosphaera aphanis]|nr:hypothetical protein K3495_g10303 [Podosphaera aphanis]